GWLASADFFLYLLNFAADVAYASVLFAAHALVVQLEGALPCSARFKAHLEAIVHIAQVIVNDRVVAVCQRRCALQFRARRGDLPLAEEHPAQAIDIRGIVL